MHAAYLLGYLNTPKMQAELEFIATNLGKWVKSPDSFCVADHTNRAGTLIYGNQYQVGQTHPENNILAGFFSGRLANAVRLEHEFPTVDLFTPAMVDFYEGAEDWYSEGFTMSVLYERISQATFGRMLPFISFNPQRAVDYAKRAEARTPLGLVKKCIKDRNFIGVKLHPSVGFGPVENGLNACPNSRKQSPAAAAAYRMRYGTKLDQVLGDLFEYCADNEVPILTHGSPGIPANAGCMMPAGHEQDWLYAPKLWGRVLDAMKLRNPQKPLRLCIGHFAGAFSATKYWQPWLDSLLQVMEAHPTLYTDISIQRGLFPSKEGNHGELRQAFTKIFENNSKILSSQALYGTDWHMPETMDVGGEYLHTLRDLVPASMRDNVFGLNAVEFLGLRKGRMNRARIDEYQTWLQAQRPARAPKGYVPGWMAKVDALKA
jgi:predicted TIM-barrel fold metal-dependent hydrolase